MADESEADRVFCASLCERMPLLIATGSAHRCEQCGKSVHAWCQYKPGGDKAGEEAEGYGSKGLCRPCSKSVLENFLIRRGEDGEVAVDLSGDRGAGRRRRHRPDSDDGQGVDADQADAYDRVQQQFAVAAALLEAECDVDDDDNDDDLPILGPQMRGGKKKRTAGAAAGATARLRDVRQRRVNESIVGRENSNRVELDDHGNPVRQEGTMPPSRGRRTRGHIRGQARLPTNIQSSRRGLIRDPRRGSNGGQDANDDEEGVDLNGGVGGQPPPGAAARRSRIQLAGPLSEDESYEPSQDSTDSSGTCADDDEPFGGLEATWTRVPLGDFGSASGVTLEFDAVDRKLKDTYVAECRVIGLRVAEKLGITFERLLESPPSERDIFSLFFTDVVLATVVEMAKSGHSAGDGASRGGVHLISIESVRAYVILHIVCGVVTDTTPLQVLEEDVKSDRLRWYKLDGVRKLITADAFRAIRDGLGKCEGYKGQDVSGDGSLAWQNSLVSSPFHMSRLERAVADVSKPYAIHPTLSLCGADDDCIRYASRRPREQNLRQSHGKKGASIHTTTFGSVLTSILAAVHATTKGETVLDTLNACFGLAFAGTASQKSDRGMALLFRGLLFGLDQHYLTEEVVGVVVGEMHGRALGSQKKTAKLPFRLASKASVENSTGEVTTGAGASVFGKLNKDTVLTHGIREETTYKTRTYGAIGKELYLAVYKAPGDTSNVGCVLYTKDDSMMAPNMFMALPRNRSSWQRDVHRAAFEPRCIAADVAGDLPECAFNSWSDVQCAAREALEAHELTNVHLLTEQQSNDQCWWLLKTRGISSTVSGFILQLCAGKGKLLMENTGVHEGWKVLSRTFGVRSRSGTSEFEGLAQPDDMPLAQVVEGLTAQSLARAYSLDELRTCAARFGLRAQGTRAQIATRIMEASTTTSTAPLPTDEATRNYLVERVDQRLFSKRFKGTSFTESGNFNERKLVKAVPELFRRGESERLAHGEAPNQRLVLIVERGLVASRHNVHLLTSPDAVGVIWTPPCASDQSNNMTSSGVFEIVPIEAKTCHDEALHTRRSQRLRASMAESARVHVTYEDVMNLRSDTEEAWESSTRSMRYMVMHNLHVTQIFHHMLVYTCPRALYVVGGTHGAPTLLEISQGTVATAVGASQEAKTWMEGSAVTTQYCGIVSTLLYDVLFTFVRHSGVSVLFNDKGNGVPEIVQQSSYVQSKHARIQNAQLRGAAFRKAISSVSPLPSTKSIRSSAIHAWNTMGKVFSDSESRRVMETFPSFFSDHISAKMTMRNIWHLLVNSRQVTKICVSLKAILHPETDRSYAALKRHVNLKGGTEQDFLLAILRQHDLPGPELRLEGATPGRPLLGGSSATVTTEVRNNLAVTLNATLPALPRFTKVTFLDVFNEDPSKERRLTSNATIQHIPRVPFGRSSGVQCWLCSYSMSAVDRVKLQQRRRVSRDQSTAAAALAAIDAAIEANESGTVEVHDSRITRMRSRTKFFCYDCGGVFLCRRRKRILGDDKNVVQSGKSCWDMFHTEEILARITPVQWSSNFQEDGEHEGDEKSRDDSE